MEEVNLGIRVEGFSLVTSHFVVLSLNFLECAWIPYAYFFFTVVL